LRASVRICGGRTTQELDRSTPISWAADPSSNKGANNLL